MNPNYTWEQIVIAMTSTSEALREFPPNIYWCVNKIHKNQLNSIEINTKDLKCYIISLYILSFIVNYHSVTNLGRRRLINLAK